MQKSSDSFLPTQHKFLVLNMYFWNKSDKEIYIKTFPLVHVYYLNLCAHRSKVKYRMIKIYKSLVETILSWLEQTVSNYCWDPMSLMYYLLSWCRSVIIVCLCLLSNFKKRWSVKIRRMINYISTLYLHFKVKTGHIWAEKRTSHLLRFLLCLMLLYIDF